MQRLGRAWIRCVSCKLESLVSSVVVSVGTLVNFSHHLLTIIVGELHMRSAFVV